MLTEVLKVENEYSSFEFAYIDSDKIIAIEDYDSNYLATDIPILHIKCISGYGILIVEYAEDFINRITDKELSAMAIAQEIRRQLEK